jgi:hypothetical protein
MDPVVYSKVPLIRNPVLETAALRGQPWPPRRKKLPVAGCQGAVFKPPHQPPMAQAVQGCWGGPTVSKGLCTFAWHFGCMAQKPHCPQMGGWARAPGPTGHTGAHMPHCGLGGCLAWGLTWGLGGWVAHDLKPACQPPSQPPTLPLV